MVPGGGLRGQTSLSVGALLGNLVEGGGGSSTGALQRLWRGAPFSTGALLSIMECPFTRNFERQLKGGSGNRATLSTGALLGEPGGGGLLC